MDQTMQAMMKAMAESSMTGDPDHDFAAMMVPHHEGAIAMAKAVLEHGKDPVLRRLAQEIIVTQQQEIQVLKGRLSTQPAAPRNASLPGAVKEEHRPPAGSAGPVIPITAQDRVYTSDQTSNTVSVIDPAANRLLGVIHLGDPVPGSLSPLYKNQLLVHGGGFSPDHRTLATVSIGSNSVTLIDTATNKVKGVVYIGRSPHEAFFTPDGKELWATVRGENYVSVIDPVRMREKRRVTTASGPGMVLFRPDGKYAFVPSSFTPEVDVVDTKTYRVVARVPQASPFSPNLAVSRDGTEVWFTLKDSGKTQVMTARPPFRILSTIDSGPITNHVALVDNSAGKFAYVTVGGENVIKVYRRGRAPSLVATIPTGHLPHGIWGSGDGTRVYVGLENQDAVVAVDTLQNKVIATIPVGQQPQQLLYVPRAVPEGTGTANLQPLAVAGKAGHLTLATPKGLSEHVHATVSVNALGALDLLQVAATGLKPGKNYTLWLTERRTAPFGHKQALTMFTANAAGAQVSQAIGLLREVLTPPKPSNSAPDRRYLIITPAGSANAVATQDRYQPMPPPEKPSPQPAPAAGGT
jgi:YVTN family beta-propeller protein